MTKLNLPQKLEIGSTALLVIDIQNDFCSPSGLMASMGKDISGMLPMIGRLKKLIHVCDQVGVPVFYTQQIYDRAKLSDIQKEQYDLDGKLITCDVAGNGYKFYEINPPSDRVYPKYNYNVFSNSVLAQELVERGIKTLIITGVVTQVCVETAIRNGFDIGYKIVVPEDLVATTSRDADVQERTLRLVSKTYGSVVRSSEIIAIFDNRTPLYPNAQANDHTSQ
jgi:ureidoacrylate peracid hydrolase